jgi:tetratricopeptide (TPR) repeat protein
MKQHVLAAILHLAFSTTWAQTAYHHHNKGVGQMSYEQYEEAIVSFTNAVQLKSDYANAYANRGLCYHRQQKYDLALADYLRSEKHTKGLSSYNIACAYSLLGKPDDAFTWLTACQQSEYKQSRSMMESDPDFDNIRKDSRWKAIVEKDWYSPYDKAIQEIDVRWNNNDVQGAIEQCTRAMALDPSKTKPLLTRAYIYSTQEQWDRAHADCDRAIQMNNKDWEGYATKAGLYYKQRNYSEALTGYQKAMNVNPEYMPLSELAMVHFALGQHSEAITDLKTLLEFYPSDDFSTYFCGYIYYQKAQDGPALEYAERAIELNPKEPGYVLLKGKILLGMKEFDKAISSFDLALQMDSNSGEAYYNRGVARAERFARSANPQDKVGFCEDMKRAEELQVEGAAQYRRELCK